MKLGQIMGSRNEAVLSVSPLHQFTRLNLQAWTEASGRVVHSRIGSLSLLSFKKDLVG